MKINGLYFDAKEAKQMLKDIKARLPVMPLGKRTALMPVIKSAMETSACQGGNGAQLNST